MKTAPGRHKRYCLPHVLSTVVLSTRVLSTRVLSTRVLRIQGSRPGGYTLIEMLIASVLVAALMSAVWGMMSMYNSYLTAGQSQAFSRQLSRSLSDLIVRDLRSVTIPDPFTERSSQTGIMPSAAVSQDTPEAASGDVSSLSESAVVSETAETQNIRSTAAPMESLPNSQTSSSGPVATELTGTSSSLQLTVTQTPDAFRSLSSTSSSDAARHDEGRRSQPEPDLTWMEENKSPAVRQFQTIVYQFERHTTEGSSNAVMSGGLHRFQTDALRLRNLREALSQSDTASAAGDSLRIDAVLQEMLMRPSAADSRNESDGSLVPSPAEHDAVPEVRRCRFEYFDGTKWRSAWNSSRQRQLPVAVRVRMQIETERQREQRLNRVSSDSENEQTSGEESVFDNVDDSAADDINDLSSSEFQEDTAGSSDDSSGESRELNSENEAEYMVIMRSVPHRLPSRMTGGLAEPEPETGNSAGGTFP